jgi:hypothetical protein
MGKLPGLIIIAVNKVSILKRWSSLLFLVVYVLLVLEVYIQEKYNKNAEILTES